MAWFIGLMSGTSLDGVDAVLLACEGGRPTPPGRDAASTSRHVHLAMPDALRAELLSLNAPGADELHRAALASTALMRLYADAVAALLTQNGMTRADVLALGAHGQTVRHRPGEFDGIGYTLQLTNGALLAECTGIDVVCDFRSRDLAAGGQAAPLLPAFHAACFGRPGRERAVLNLGGIANLSLLGRDGGVTGFDTGPANVLLDLWCERHLGRHFDANGAYSRGSRPSPALMIGRDRVTDPDDERDFRRFFEQHHADLSRLAYLVTGESGVADDLAADAFVEVWRHWDRVQAADSPIAYARGILANLARQWIKRQSRERAGLLGLGLLRRDRTEPDTPVVLDVRAALRHLPLRRRECVVLRYAFDVPEREVAEILGISIGAVKSLTSRGAAQLSQHLQELPVTTGGLNAST